MVAGGSDYILGRAGQWGHVAEHVTDHSIGIEGVLKGFRYSVRVLFAFMYNIR